MEEIAGTLSRTWIPSASELGKEGHGISAACQWIYLHISAVKLMEIKEAAEKDIQAQAVKRAILAGWPEDNSQVDELNVPEGIVFRGQRAVVPDIRMSCKKINTCLAPGH